MRDNTPKSTRTQGGDPIADYIRADTRLPAYLPYPRFLLKMEISQTAKLLYSLLLDRSTLSQKNKWLDDEGRIYIIYPIAEIAEILDKGSTTIKGALNELDTAGLLERERGGFSAPNRLYVKVPPVPQVQFSDQLMAGSPPLIEPENRPTVATHTDRAHIHNHIIYNSTALDGRKKFRNFWLSTFAVQRLSDLICLEHQLSTIEYKPYRERQKRIVYPPKESNRDRLCGIIDTILAEKPGDYETFLQKLEQQGYEVKRGKYTSVKGKGQKRFIRFRTLGTGYGEDEIKAVLEGKAEHLPHQKQPPKEQPLQLLVDIQGKMAAGKSVGYKKWATKFNLKEMSKTLLFLQEQKISSADELRERTAAATERYHTMGDSIKAAEARLTEIAVLKTHIINYAKTRPVYDAYRKSGYSKKYLEAHREEITLHKAAKAAFDEAGLQKLPKVKELDAEFAELLTQKKAAYPDYRKARNEMQELVRAQKNVERFFAEEKENTEKTQTR